MIVQYITTVCMRGALNNINILRHDNYGSYTKAYRETEG